MTIKDIAKESGYSVSTVSRVLNNRDDVSPEAEKKIRRIVAEHNFVPNGNAKHLKQIASKTICVLVKGTSNMVFSGIAEEIQTIVNKTSYTLNMIYLDEEENEVEQAIIQCRERKPLGILFLGGNPAFFREKFHEVKVPSVLVSTAGKDLGFPFYDIFEKQELFDIWQIHNYKNYVCDGPSPMTNGLMVANAKPTLENIIAAADEAIASGRNSATFRFAHDGNIIPLAGLMKLENCYNEEADPDKFYQAWCNYKVAPMAGNIQLVFFRKKGSPEDVIVKLLLHEHEVSIPVKTDMAPFYHWQDVRAFYKGIVDSLPDRP